MVGVTEHPLIKKLLGLDLPKEDYAIFGSGPMFAHGIKDLGHDLDIIARGRAWKKALELGEAKAAPHGNDTVVTLFDGAIEIFNGWSPGNWNTDELIDGAEMIDGVKFVTLNNVVRWKKLYGRPKDLQHIRMIENYLPKSGHDRGSSWEGEKA